MELENTENSHPNANSQMNYFTNSNGGQDFIGKSEFNGFIPQSQGINYVQPNGFSNQQMIHPMFNVQFPANANNFFQTNTPNLFQSNNYCENNANPFNFQPNLFHQNSIYLKDDDFDEDYKIPDNMSDSDNEMPSDMAKEDELEEEIPFDLQHYLSVRGQL